MDILHENFDKQNLIFVLFKTMLEVSICNVFDQILNLRCHSADSNQQVGCQNAVIMHCIISIEIFSEVMHRHLVVALIEYESFS